MSAARESEVSSQCSESTRPVVAAYCSARRRSEAESTGRPSSEKPHAPWSASSPSGASCSPFCPTEIAARKPTRTRASSAACSCSDASTCGVSTTGSVFGIASTLQ